MVSAWWGWFAKMGLRARSHQPDREDLEFGALCDSYSRKPLTYLSHSHLFKLLVNGTHKGMLKKYLGG